MPSEAMSRSQPPPSRRRLKSTLLRLLILSVCLYLAPLVWLSFYQGTLIFHPGHYAAADWPASRLPPDVQPLTLRIQGRATVAALFGPALTANGRPDPAASHRPTLLYFHGNGGDLRDTLGELQKFRRMDVNVMAPDYVGYGLSRAVPTERGCDAAAQAAYDALLARRDIDPARIVILGHSLGTAVAVALTALVLHMYRPVAGLALVSGFTSMPEEGHSQYPIYPVSLMRLAARYPFDSVRRTKRVTCPVFIAHSRSDGLIPYDMAARLTAASGGPVTRLTFDHVPHGYAFSEGASQVLPPLRTFIFRVVGIPAP